MRGGMWHAAMRHHGLLLSFPSPRICFPDTSLPQCVTTGHGALSRIWKWPRTLCLVVLPRLPSPAHGPMRWRKYHAVERCDTILPHLPAHACSCSTCQCLILTQAAHAPARHYSTHETIPEYRDRAAAMHPCGGHSPAAVAQLLRRPGGVHV